MSIIPVSAPAGFVPQMAVTFSSGGGAMPVDADNPLPIGERAYQGAVLAGLRGARATYPAIPILVFGCHGASYVSSVLTNEAAVQAAVAQAADPMCAFVPLSSDPNGAWVTGSGKIGAAANDGNSDWVTVSDGTHPTDEGATYLGRRYAAAAVKALAALYTVG